MKAFAKAVFEAVKSQKARKAEAALIAIVVSEVVRQLQG